MNKQLLEEGMAKSAYELEPPYKRANEYSQGQSSGMESGKGIWGIDGYAVPVSSIPFSTDFSLPGYNEFKKKKINEISTKKSNISINTNPFQNVLNRLR